MTRTIKLRYLGRSGFAEVLSEQRRLQSRLIRFAYRRLIDGTALGDLYSVLRSHAVGQGLHTWLILSGMKRASAIYARFPEGGIVFGGRRALVERAQGRISREEWRSARLMPLYVEGHARSYGSQGGNHLATLDLAEDRVTFHGPNGVDYPLQLFLSRKSREYRRRLTELQARCETLRDTPFTVSINEQEIALTWKVPAAAPSPGIAGRVLALDLNPAKLGWAVVEGDLVEAGSCRCAAWGILEFPEFSRRLGLASDDPKSISNSCKRRHELAILARKMALLAKHYQVSAVITEQLAIGPKDHGKGRRFNRQINQVWFRRGLLEPMARRLAAAGITHSQVNPAYSSKLGNTLWANLLRIPDPACAAVEIGRRAIWQIKFPAPQKDSAKPPMPNVRRRRKDGARARSPKGPALGGWQRVWSQLEPKAADTRRRSRADLRPLLPPGNPRLAPLVNPRSKVLRYEPREGTSPPFGGGLHALCVKLAAGADLCRRV
jgi:IS605 OrfB family transposase